MHRAVQISKVKCSKCSFTIAQVLETVTVYPTAKEICIITDQPKRLAREVARWQMPGVSMCSHDKLLSDLGGLAVAHRHHMHAALSRGMLLGPYLDPLHPSARTSCIPQHCASTCMQQLHCCVTRGPRHCWCSAALQLRHAALKQVAETKSLEHAAAFSMPECVALKP